MVSQVKTVNNFFFSIKILALVAKDTQYCCTIANFACMPKG